MLKKYIIIILLLMFAGCSDENISLQKKLDIKLVDSKATYETVFLFYNLKRNAGNKILFGHQDATSYGIGWKDEYNKSDVKEVSGSHPALYGWDFSWITNKNDTSKIKALRDLTVEAYERGGVQTFAWHYNNPVTGGSFYDTTVVVKYLLPGQSHHEIFKTHLDKIADFTNTLKGNNGKLIPIIFRPFHELDGNWFWWGQNFCTPEEIKSLWQFMVNYLGDEKKVVNMLFAFSPDRNFNTETEFLTRYPGDDYVDIIGLDNYWDFKPEGDGINAVINKLKIISSLANKRNKVAAFTETGMETIPDSIWWTQKLLPVITADSVTVSWVMVWRNAHKGHHYAPYPGHPSVDDFIKFKTHPNIIFLDEMYNIYRIPNYSDL